MSFQEKTIAAGSRDHEKSSNIKIDVDEDRQKKSSPAKGEEIILRRS